MKLELATMIALFVFVWARNIYLARENKKLRQAVKNADKILSELQATSLKHLVEFYEFKKKFEEYRARHDPIDLKRDGNVITIERKPE